MNTEVSESRDMEAAPAAVYGVISDYRNGHPRILPKPFFGELIVEEPEPGRVLVERYPDTGGVTTFTVDPRGAGCRVTIHTTFPARGIKGLIEKLFAPPMLRKVFREELEMLEKVASSELASA